MHKRITRRGAIAALSALAAFAAANLVAPSNAAAQLSKGLNAEFVPVTLGATLQLLTEPIPAGAGADNGDNFGGPLGFNLPTTAPNFSKIHDFTSFRLTAPFSCRHNCLADVQDAIKNDGTIFLALAPAGYCATQFPSEGSPIILRIPAAELHVNGGLFTWSGRPIALPLLDGPATALARLKAAPTAPARRQPRFVNLSLTVTGGFFGLLEGGVVTVDGDADLTSLLAGAPGVTPDAVFPSGPGSIKTDVLFALATGVGGASYDISAPSDPGLPLGFVASCETLNAPITSENPPGL
jgi:hypothetical protein